MEKGRWPEMKDNSVKKSKAVINAWNCRIDLFYKFININGY